MLERLAPAVFVLLWSTGWLAAGYAAQHADPFTFLALRYGFSILAFAVFCLVVKARWPRSLWQSLKAIWSGMFLHGFYLAALWWAIARGVPTGLSGIIAALQPLLTAVAAAWLIGERLAKMQKIGLLLGFAGIALAISPKLMAIDPANLGETALPLFVNLLGMVSVTYGTVYQKQHLQEGDINSIATLQYVGALLVTGPLALITENLHFDGSLTVILTMLWSVFGLSMGAIGLLLYLIRRGQVSKAASLIYLVPPLVAVEAAIAFGEPLTTPLIAGTAIVVVGVYFTNRRAGRR